ncbi:MAG: thiamine phosphate synthase [Halanaerobiales bacterium]
MTEEKLSKGRTTLEVVKKALAGGVDVVQLRDKNLSLRERYQLGKKIRKFTLKKDVSFIVNDRVDLALALGADGVHLGQNDIPLKEAKKLLAPDKIIGISANTVRDAKTAEEGGADYLGVGAIFPTESKKGKKSNAGIGLKGLKKIRNKTNLPLIAVGGLKPENYKEVLEAGADTISVISALTMAEDIAKVAKKFRKFIIKTKEEEL